MKTMKTILAASTAIALAGAAWADENKSYLDQSGNDNDAQIEQSGSNNAAGNDGSSRDNPTLTREQRHVMTQDGDENDLDLRQSGNNNNFGANTRLGDSATGTGIDQVGDNNVADVTQSSDYNYVNRLQQTAPDDAAGTKNSVEVTQRTLDGQTGVQSGNLVSSIRQTYDASVGTGNANALTITQSREGKRGNGGAGSNVIADSGPMGSNSSDRNTAAGGVVQDGSGNMAALTQTGTVNIIRSVVQDGGDNSVTIDQDGAGNGSGAFTGGSFAEGTGVTRSTVTQEGSGNTVNYFVEGDDNQFGFLQDGNSNTVGTVDITGLGNQTAASQTGDGNILDLQPVVGDDNNVGVVQDSTGYSLGNEAYVALTNGSNRNQIGVRQIGTNYADVDVDGNDNYADIQQTGMNGVGFGVVLSMSGDFNGTGTFTDDAAIGLTNGTIIQDGGNNLFDTEIDGNSNMFAGMQDGDYNESLATVNGSFNQFAVSQLGNGNMSSLTQLGTGNNAGISQGM